MKSKKKRNISDTNLLLTITIVVFFAMYIGAMIFQGGGFLKTQTFFNILNANAALLITSCGLSLVMITGGIDISVGGVVALVSMSCGVYLDYMGGNVAMSILIALGIGLAFGLVQGFLVAYLDIQPFIVTLAGMFFARGMTTIVHTDPFNVQNKAFVALKDTRVIVPGMGSVNRIGKYVDAYVEIGVIVALLIVVLMFVMLRWSKLGRAFYAVGGNKQSALMLGINVKRTRFLAAFQWSSGGNRRLCIFPSRRIRFCFPCDRNGNERNRFLYHWWNTSDRWCWKYYRNIFRSTFFKYNPEYRIFRRSGSGMVDRNYDRSNALSVPCNPEYCYGS